MERVHNEIRLSFSQNYFGRKEHDKITQLQTHNTFHEKRINDSEGGTRIPEVELRTMEDYSHILKPNQGKSNICPAGFQDS